MNLICLACLGFFPYADGGERSQLLKLWKERQKITSGEFTVRTRFLLNKSIPLFEGAEWEFHLWWTSDQKVFRLDRHRVEKKRPEDADHLDQASFDGDTYRLIGRKDSPFFPVCEYRSVKPNEVQIQLFDPRLFGLYPDSMETFHNDTPQDLGRVVSEAASVKEGDDSGGTFEIYKGGDSLVYSYYYNRAGQPVRVDVEGNAKSKIRHESRMEYDQADGGSAAFPTRIDFKLYQNGVLDTHEVIELHAFNLNVPVDRSLCGWAALQPHPGARLVVDDDNSNVKEFWDGEQMRPIPVGFGDGDPMVISRANRSMKLLVAVSIAGACVMLLAYRLVRRRGGVQKDVS